MDRLGAGPIVRSPYVRRGRAPSRVEGQQRADESLLVRITALSRSLRRPCSIPSNPAGTPVPSSCLALQECLP